ncbi:MAG: exodeoxyribonuclease VII large subunit [Fulvimonas sp.]|nr:exodeoxyribonuclease VII large subunit [Fulvimonas sp.]
MPPPDDRAAARPILTPSALNRLVRDLLEDALPLVWVEGELSNVSRPASGHLYFTLKDNAAQVRCAMFKPKSSWLRFKPGDGMQVLLRARVGLYEPRGEFQLVVEQMEPAGEGALRRLFEELKARLAAEGLFDAARKRPLPRHVRRLGVITSATGAAIRDVLSVLARRWPLLEVEVLPVPVQGREAPPAIVAMLGKASACGRYDALLLTRGGGSLEDLMAFNDEAVARAVAASAVPVVCAVGHEVDFAIAEFAADLRAPTPSAAAELLVPDAQAVRRHLQQLAQRLQVFGVGRLQAQSQHLDLLHARLQAQRPQARLARDRLRLQQLHHRLHGALDGDLRRQRDLVARLEAQLFARHPRQLIAQQRRRLTADRHALRQAMTAALERSRLLLGQSARALHAVSPLATLERGYAILLDAEGRVLRSVHAAHAGQPLRGRLADGELALRVQDAAIGESPGAAPAPLMPDP